MITAIVLLCVLLGLIVLLAFWNKVEYALFRWQFDRKYKNANIENRGVLEDAKNGRIETDPSGLDIKDIKGRSTKLKWDDISQISAYKADLLTVDLILVRLQYRIDGNTYLIDVNEEMLGFIEMMEKLGKEFSISNVDWWMKVAFPAFAENHTILWSRESAAGVQQMHP